MAEEHELPDLLPFDFAPPKVLTPEQILRHQASLINERSGGRLKASIERTETEETLSLSFTLGAAALDYSVRLFFCSHQRTLPYPTAVYFQEFNRDAHTEDDFRILVTTIFASGTAKSMFQSLLARQGEVSAKD